MVAFWRLGLGRPVQWFHPLTGRILVLGTRGRKSGRMRRTPLNYAPGQGFALITAGFPRTDWLRNLQADPAVEVWLPEGRWRARAALERDPEGVRQVLRCSGALPRWLSGVHPGLPDEQLADFPLVRLTLQERL